MSIQRTLARIIYPDIFKDFDNLYDKKEELFASNFKKNEQIDKLKKDISDLNARLEEAIFQNIELIKNGKETTELEDFCIKNFKEVDKFAYKDKGVFKDKKYPMYMNELIQPNVYLVEAIRKEIKKSDDLKAWMTNIAKHVDGLLKWTSDSNTNNLLDAWQDIYATILSPKQDCENHSFLVSSLEPKSGIAVGYCGETYHAWNCFVYNDQLYCVETNSVYDYNKNAKVFKYVGQSRYKIDHIFTQNKTFQCSAKPTQFGIKVK